MGAGVAMLDYNNDGRLDLFFVNGARLRDSMPAGYKPEKTDPRYWNRLFHNNGNGTFQDVTEAAGLRGDRYGMGVTVGDFNKRRLSRSVRHRRGPESPVPQQRRWHIHGCHG